MDQLAKANQESSQMEAKSTNQSPEGSRLHTKVTPNKRRKRNEKLKKSIKRTFKKRKKKQGNIPKTKNKSSRRHLDFNSELSVVSRAKSKQSFFDLQSKLQTIREEPETKPGPIRKKEAEEDEGSGCSAVMGVSAKIVIHSILFNLIAVIGCLLVQNYTYILNSKREKLILTEKIKNKFFSLFLILFFRI